MAGIEVLSPLDGAPLGLYAPAGAEAVQAAMAAARREAGPWSARSVAERAGVLRPLRRLILERADEIVERLCRLTGKVPADALLGEIYPVLDLLRYYEENAAKVLAPRRVPTPPLAFPFAHAYVEQRPHGVAAIISPWNYPFQLSLVPTITALLAGNTVCLKPSELSLPIGDLMRELFDAVPGLGPLLHILPGAGETGRLLVEAGPDLVFFTGSVATGRKIMAAASARLTPLILELGGKDAMLVFDDAPFERAVRAAVYGAFINSGQMCISVERALVQRGIYPAFVEAAVAETARLNVAADGDLGAMTSPAQIAIVEEHYRDAMAKGAKASGPLRKEGRYLHPVVLWDVNPSMKIMREETFGPLLPIMPFDGEDEAVGLANDSEFGLNGSVFTADLERGKRVASRLDLGGCAVNDVIKNVGHPGLPFGGVKRSGFGRYHGAEGLLAFSRPASILANSGRMATEPNWFPYGEQRYRDLRGFVDFVYGEGPLLARFRRNWSALKSFRQFFTFNLRQKLRQP
jgi:acyl-CoA reductase-like NAD-dependent aldehyde dehydrogenase